MKLNKSFVLIIVFSLFAFTGPVFAQENNASPSAAAKYKITFPVAELGNCSSLQECKAYCQDETHKDACITFAKEKGFYKSPQVKQNSEVDAKRNSLLIKAGEILGCDSQEACKAFCSDSANFSKCAEFARTALFGKSDKQATGEGKPTPNQKAFEKANANARFCRENPEKCKNASGSGSLKELKQKEFELEKKKKEQRQEFEKKELERKQEKLKKELENESEDLEEEIEKESETEKELENVQGVSASPSLFEIIKQFFFK